MRRSAWGRLARWLGLLGLALAFGFLLLPSVVVLPMSFSSQSYLSFPPTGWSMRWYGALLANAGWREAAVNSFVIGVPAASIATVLGTFGALAVERGALRLAGAVSALMIAPMLLPHVILAIGLYPVVLELGLLRGYAGAILAHAVIGTPLVFLSVGAALRGYSPSYELAAMTCGAGRWRCFLHVTLPMIRPGLIGGGILAFATSFDELMLVLFLTDTSTRTLPRLIWEQLNDFMTPVLAAVASLILAFSLLLLTTLAVFGGGRRRGSAVQGAVAGA